MSEPFVMPDWLERRRVAEGLNFNRILGGIQLYVGRNGLDNYEEEQCLAVVQVNPVEDLDGINWIALRNGWVQAWNNLTDVQKAEYINRPPVHQPSVAYTRHRGYFAFLRARRGLSLFDKDLQWEALGPDGRAAWQTGRVTN